MGEIKGCYYCDQDQGFRELLFKVCDLEVSTVFLCKDQTLSGRCTIMFHKHYHELYEIPEEERNQYMDEVCLLARTIKELFGADKINYGIYGDEVPHVHYTLCPKYRGRLGWGRPFVMFPEENEMIVLTDEEYQERIGMIRRRLDERREEML